MIKTNNFVEETSVRENVVDSIAEAMLASTISSVFHPGNDGRGRSRTNYIVAHKYNKAGFVPKFYGFKDEQWIFNEIAIKINFYEVKQAIKELVDAGYFVYVVYKYGTWKGYTASAKPIYDNNYYRVYEYSDADRF